MTLTEFVLARIAEDEGWARQAIVEPQQGHRRTLPGVWTSPASGVVQTDDDLWTTGDGRTSYFVQQFDPARVLAECEAKRRIVELLPEQDPDRFGAELDTMNRWDSGWYAACEEAVYALAVVYADHPDFDPRWKP